MTPLLFYVLGGSVCELFVHVLPPQERRTKITAAWLALGAVVFMACLMVLTGGVLGYVLAAVSVYRLFNLLRIIRHRMHDNYLRRVTLRTSLFLGSFQISAILVAYVLSSFHVSALAVMTGLLCVEAFAALLFLRTAQRHAVMMRSSGELTPVHDKELPTVTIAIPARNETDDLEQCLDSVLGIQYPKLEVLVLDDCSQATRTPEIIRHFAHDGVRFIKGEEPKENWLAKNQAYETLAKEANGEIIIFAGVDVRFAPLTIRKMVQYMTAKHKTMLCVMPENRHGHSRLPLIQPMRYVWELALPRRAFDRPPVLSTCWAISREALNKAGGFQAASRMVVPEMYLARQQLTQDGYAFITGGTEFGVISEKSVVEQRATAIRTAYPLLHRRPETVTMLAVVYMAWVGLPVAAVCMYISSRQAGTAFLFAIIVCLCTGWMYDIVWRLAYGRHNILACFSLPLATLLYVGLVHLSMYKYEFSEVLWKGRNVCLPVMHVVPKLPPL